MGSVVTPAWWNQEDLGQKIPELNPEGGIEEKQARQGWGPHTQGERHEQRPGVQNCLSRYPFPRLVLPSPSLLFLDHVKIKNKPGKNGFIHKARKISLALLSDKYLPSFLDKYCEREPEKEM